MVLCWWMKSIREDAVNDMNETKDRAFLGFLIEIWKEEEWDPPNDTPKEMGWQEESHQSTITESKNSGGKP